MARVPFVIVTLLAVPIMKSFERPPSVGPQKIPTYPCQVGARMGWSYGEFVFNLNCTCLKIMKHLFHTLLQVQMRVRRSEILLNWETLAYTQPTTYHPKLNRASCLKYTFTSLGGLYDLILGTNL